MKRRVVLLSLAAALTAGRARPQSPIAWFAENDAGWRVRSLGPAGLQTAYTPPAGVPITDIAVDRQGRLYVAQQSTPPASPLVRVDAGGVVTGLLPPGEMVGRIHVDAADTVYYVRGSNELGRVSPPSIPYAGSGPDTISDLATDAFGSVHLVLPHTPIGGSNHVSKLDKLGNTVLVPAYVSPTGATVVQGAAISRCGTLFVVEADPTGDRIVAVDVTGASNAFTATLQERICPSIDAHPSGQILAALNDAAPAPAMPARLVAIAGQVATTLYSTSAGGTIVAVALAQALLDCPSATFATGAVGGSAGPVDVLIVNGSAGGTLRRVQVGVGQPIAIALAAPPAATGPVDFHLFGRVGSPEVRSVLPDLAGLGGFAFFPCVLDPSNASLFELAGSFPFGPCPRFVFATPAPWSAPVLPATAFPFTWTLQGVIADPSAASPAFATTNAVVIDVR